MTTSAYWNIIGFAVYFVLDYMITIVIVIIVIMIGSSCVLIAVFVLLSF